MGTGRSARLFSNKRPAEFVITKPTADAASRRTAVPCTKVQSRGDAGPESRDALTPPAFVCGSWDRERPRKSRAASTRAREALHTDPFPMNLEDLYLYLPLVLRQGDLRSPLPTPTPPRGLGRRVSQLIGLAVVKPGQSMANWAELVTPQCPRILSIRAPLPICCFFPPLISPVLRLPSRPTRGLRRLPTPRPHRRSMISQARAMGLRQAALNSWWGKDVGGDTLSYLEETLCKPRLLMTRIISR